MKDKEEYRDIYAEFSVNEKVALEVAIGSSIAGARSLVAMKHVGVNVAADPLFTFTETRTKGGFVLMSGDDPGMASSQNEQDNRVLGKFANMPIFDPSDSQEAKDYTKLALDVSEDFETPVMLRITSRLCHGRSTVIEEDRISKPVKGFQKSPSDYGMIPPNTFDKQFHMKERIQKIQLMLESDAFSYLSDMNRVEVDETSKTLIITSGLPYHNLKELKPKASILKLGIVSPLPIEKIRKLSSSYDQVIVIEEMMPFIEEQIKLEGIPCMGKALFSFTGELDVADIEKGLSKAGVIMENMLDAPTSVTDPELMGRLPMFCSGCPHRPVFDILKKTKKTVIGDIGCYSMGMMKGMKKAQRMAGNNEPLIAVIGDGTFYHSGMTGLLNLLHQYDPEDNMTLIILNNGTTAMTGGQPNASSANYSDGSDMDIDMDKLIKTMGFERVTVVDQFKYKEAKRIIDEEIKHDGLSIVITTRPCALKFKIKKPHFYVDPEVCIACRSCVKTNCPPIHMKTYEGFDKQKSSIDPTMCVGCSVCSQVCPVGAIKRSQEV